MHTLKLFTIVHCHCIQDIISLGLSAYFGVFLRISINVIFWTAVVMSVFSPIIFLPQVLLRVRLQSSSPCWNTGWRVVSIGHDHWQHSWLHKFHCHWHPFLAYLLFMYPAMSSGPLWPAPSYKWTNCKYSVITIGLECGPMPNVMVALRI